MSISMYVSGVGRFQDKIVACPCSRGGCTGVGITGSGRTSWWRTSHPERVTEEIRLFDDVVF